MIKNKPLVSISCITYNHAPYLRQCLDGFFMQKCDFEYEILLHDDASTDGSQEIIKEYMEKHPGIIKPIFQTKNQYSQGVRSINMTFNAPRAQGKYIALCEGDDYWTDPFKLQKQVDFMESHPEIIFSFHGATILEPNGTKKEFRLPILINDYKVNKSSLIIRGGGAFHTGAVMFRKELLNEPLPNYSKISPVGDFAFALLAADRGEIGYIPDDMAVYRYMHPTSWTNSRSLEEKLKNSAAILKTTSSFNLETNYRFSKEVKTLNRMTNSAIISHHIMHKSFLKGLIIILKNIKNIGLDRSIYNFKVLMNKAIS